MEVMSTHSNSCAKCHLVRNNYPVLGPVLFPWMVLLNLISNALCIYQYVLCRSPKWEIYLSLGSGQVLWLVLVKEGRRKKTSLETLLSSTSSQMEAFLWDEERCGSIICADPAGGQPASRSRAPQWLAAEPKAHKWAHPRPEEPSSWVKLQL